MNHETFTIPMTRMPQDALYVPDFLVAERPPGNPARTPTRPAVAPGAPPMPELALLRPWTMA